MTNLLNRTTAYLILLLTTLFLFDTICQAQDQPKEKPYFTDVAKELGLTGVKATTLCFTDLNADGWWDVFLDKRHAFINQNGKSFQAHDTGIPFPTYKHIPVGQDGKPDSEKAKDKPFTPGYVYFADLDNDGDMDAIVGVHAWWEFFDAGKWKYVEDCDPGFRTTIYMNDGKGKFTPGPKTGLADPKKFGPSMALAILDYDNDGCLDIYEGREYRQYGVLYGCGVDRLWKGDGAAKFSETTEAAGILTVPEPGQKNSSRPSYGVTHGDMNNDGLQDLLQLAYGRQWNYQWKNNGDGTFTDVGITTMFSGDDITHGRYPEWVKRSPEKPFRSNGNTFDCAIADYDNDGDLDCFMGEICHHWAGEASDDSALLINLGTDKNYTFQRIGVNDFLPPREVRKGHRWNHGDLHSAWIDMDNDGLLDLLIGSGDYPDGQYLRLYQQQEDHSFKEVTALAGFDWEGCGELSIADFDHDGDQDILAGRSFMRLPQKHRDQFMDGILKPVAGLFRNDIANRTGHHWLNVRLRGKGKGAANTQAIGARIWITTGDRTQMRELRCGSGLSNHQDPPEAHFGLGTASKIDKLIVQWPDTKHSREEFTDLSVDRFLLISQGKGILVDSVDEEE